LAVRAYENRAPLLGYYYSAVITVQNTSLKSSRLHKTSVWSETNVRHSQ